MPFIGMYLVVLLVIFMLCLIIVLPCMIVAFTLKGIGAAFRAWRNRKPNRHECSWQGCHRRSETQWLGAPICGMHWCWVQEHTEVHIRKT